MKVADAGAGGRKPTPRSSFFGIDDWDKWRLNVSAV
jgi:hypothetical protein